jgi:hypothetical protein
VWTTGKLPTYSSAPVIVSLTRSDGPLLHPVIRPEIDERYQALKLPLSFSQDLARPNVRAVFHVVYYYLLFSSIPFVDRRLFSGLLWQSGGAA